MPAIDVEKFLAPVSEDTPSGENLEYDPDFVALATLAQGKPEHQMGDEIIEAEEPPWPEVFSGAEDLLERTRDLRLAILLTRAGLKLDGLPGLASGLRLISSLSSTFWDTVHPELDAEDNDDPTLRMNSLASLASTTELVSDLERAPLVSAKLAGRFSYRDFKLSIGELSPAEGEEAPESQLIDAAFLECELDELTATFESVKQALESLQELDTFLRDKVGAQSAPDVAALQAELAAMQRILSEQLARRGVTEGIGEGGGDAVAAAAPAVSGEIRSREDAVRVLDRVSDYFKKHEPSSPVPLLLQRAKRLVSKDFMEVLRDLTPDAVAQAESIGGLNKDET